MKVPGLWLPEPRIERRITEVKSVAVVHQTQDGAITHINDRRTTTAKDRYRIGSFVE
jgi:hypothetical protein